MKSKIIVLFSCIASAAFLLIHLHGADNPGRAIEYATIRWAGKDNTHIIRPGGEVEFIGPQLRLLRKPDRADERSFYMNAAMNGLVKEGYDLAAFAADEIVMKRAH